MLPLVELNRREVHFLLDILELGITEVIKDEMVPQRAQNKVWVGIVLLLDRHLYILSDPALDIAKMLGLELVVVIGQMVRGESEGLGAVAFGELGLVVHLFILR